MQIIIHCTAAEQTEIKQNIKINSDDTGIIIAIKDKPEGITCGECAIGRIEWVVEGENNG